MTKAKFYAIAISAFLIVLWVSLFPQTKQPIPLGSLAKLEYINSKQARVVAIRAIWLTTGKDTVLLNPSESILIKDYRNTRIHLGNGVEEVIHLYQ